MYRMKRFFLIILFMIPLVWSTAQQIRQMEFVEQPVKDILFTLAESTGVSIITDDTVRGNASYHFSNTDLDTALEHFLSCYDLNFRKKDGVYYVSKIMVTCDGSTGLITLHAKDAPPGLICEKLSKEIKSTILFDPLPNDPVTINAEKLPVEKVLEIVMRRYSNYEIENNGDYYYIRCLPVARSASSGKGPAEIDTQNERYSISTDSIRLTEALSLLFEKAGFEYSLLKRGDAVLENINFRDKTFDALLRLLLEQCDGDFTVRNDIYYIFDVARSEILKKMADIEYIQIENIPVEIIPSLFPSGLAGPSVFKIDKDNNAIILSGTFEEVTPVREFIRNLEAEYKEKQVSRIDLSFLTVDELLKLLPARLQHMQLIRTGNPMTIIIDATGEQTEEFISFARMIDRQHEGIAVSLKYIRAEDLLKNLPPSVHRDDILQSNDPNLVFFRGSEQRLERFMEDLRYIDKPVPQIRYELLVVQYQESRNKEFSLTAENEVLQDGGQTTLLGTLGNILKLNLDIVTTFGYQFAVDLNAKLSDSEARIMADTTLNGLTGEEISFQNTNTYRYRDLEIDPDTGEVESTGVTREITSGLLININGWVSGDEMITMNVDSTVSKRGADVSSSTGNPPPTSEKVINTHVRTSPGKPIVIGGLLQQERDVIYEKTPVLSALPLLGRLFTREVETFENTELVIYIVPYIEYPDREKLSSEELFEDYYKSFFDGRARWN